MINICYIKIRDKKINCKFKVSLIVYFAIDPNHYIRYYNKFMLYKH